jgi:hypothetical protein
MKYLNPQDAPREPIGTTPISDADLRRIEEGPLDVREGGNAEQWGGIIFRKSSLGREGYAKPREYGRRAGDKPPVLTRILSVIKRSN